MRLRVLVQASSNSRSFLRAYSILEHRFPVGKCRIRSYNIYELCGMIEIVINFQDFPSTDCLPDFRRFAMLLDNIRCFYPPPKLEAILTITPYDATPLSSPSSTGAEIVSAQRT